MQPVEYVLKPSVRFKLTHAEWAILMKLSAEHYDGKCRSISIPGPGAFLYGWKWEFEPLTDDGPTQVDVAEVEATTRQLDTLCKVTEELFHPMNMRIGWDLHCALRDLLTATSNQYKTIPIEVAVGTQPPVVG